MNIAQNIERGCCLFPHKPAIIFEGKYFTYKHLNELVNRAANALTCIIHEKIEKNLKALCSLKHRDLSPTTVCDIYLLLTNNSLIIKNNSKK